MYSLGCKSSLLEGYREVSARVGRLSSLRVGQIALEYLGIAALFDGATKY